MKRSDSLLLDSNSFWFLFSLPALIGFVATQVCYLLLKLHEHPLFALNQGKRLEVVLFFGSSLLGALTYLIYYLIEERGRPNKIQDRGSFFASDFGRLQALAVLGLSFLWANQELIEKFTKPLSVLYFFNILIFLVFIFITRPALMGKNIGPHFKIVFDRSFSSILLFLGVAASLAQATSPQVGKFALPLTLGALAVFIVKIFAQRIPRWSPPRKLWYFFSLLALILTFPGYPNPDGASLSCLIGPIMQNIHGFAPLVDYRPHYGLVNGLFLEPLFRIMGGVSVDKGYYVGYISCLVYYVFLFFITRKFLSSYVAGFFCLFFSVSFQALGNLPMFYSYYSMGPYRFALPLLLIVLTQFREANPSAKWLNFLELALVGLASVWSAESFIFMWVPYLILLKYENRLLKTLPLAAFSLVLSWGLVETYIYLRSGQLGDPRLFFESVKVEAVQGMSSFNMLTTGTWVPIWFFLSAGITVSSILYLKNKGDSFLAVSTGVALISLTYFANRSIDAIFLALAPNLSYIAIAVVFRYFSEEAKVKALAFAVVSIIFYFQGGINGNTDWVLGSVGKNLTLLGKNLAESVKTRSMEPVVGDGIGQFCKPYIEELKMVENLSPNPTEHLFVLSIHGAPSTDYITSMCLNRPNAFNFNPTEATYWSSLDQQLKLNMAEKIEIPTRTYIYVDKALVYPQDPKIESLYHFKIFKILDSRYQLLERQRAGKLIAYEIMAKNSQE